jgi:pimeloyl-ACP methyl ester carboxylesterase
MPLETWWVRKEYLMPKETVTSKDGTPIAYWRSGHGEPLVLVHGTTAEHSRWAPVLPAFEEHFSVCAIDRRGRGGSGDPDAEYAIEREFEDVAAVVDSFGESAFLVGHSYGALCALEASLLTPNVRKLVLYEPPIDITDEKLNPPGLIARLEALLEAGEREEVVATMLHEAAGVPPEVVEYMRSLPAWGARVAAAHTIPRELHAQEAHRFESERFEGLEVPTLLLLGGESPGAFEKAVKAISEALPNSRIVVMEGQEHVAIDTATDLFTREVLRFLESS